MPSVSGSAIHTVSGRRIGPGPFTVGRACCFGVVLRVLLGSWVVGSRRLEALRAEVHKVQRRDYFPPPERDEVTALLRDLSRPLTPKADKAHFDQAGDQAGDRAGDRAGATHKAHGQVQG